jgi:L-asparagine transporter-like permease
VTNQETDEHRRIDMLSIAMAIGWGMFLFSFGYIIGRWG